MFGVEYSFEFWKRIKPGKWLSTWVHAEYFDRRLKREERNCDTLQDEFGSEYRLLEKGRKKLWYFAEQGWVWIYCRCFTQKFSGKENLARVLKFEIYFRCFVWKDISSALAFDRNKFYDLFAYLVDVFWSLSLIISLQVRSDCFGTLWERNLKILQMFITLMKLIQISTSSGNNILW